jgi:bifunctional pyridoxal-dependent enzyme with beta-cystathionase and maltose regulon repressor activities
LMENKVFLVLGDAVGAEQPGWFRLVFAQPPELVEEGVKRIAQALQV